MPDRPATIAALPEEPGVYRFRDADGRALYVGRAVNLRRRVSSYWGPLRGRRHLARMIPRITRIEALVCASPHEAAWAERNLLERSKPRWNRTRGEESPMYLRLDTGVRAPGLVPVHRPLPGAPHFGPYLGGHKVRVAAAGLLRVHPLVWAGSGLSPSERELLRLRGGGAPVAELAATITAVLDRDPVAVAQLRAELARRRDAAAEALGFELAGRIQEELEAVEWLVAPQGVTCPGGGDADVRGWAGGVALRFEVRDGVLRGWRQRPTSEPGSGADGPPAWAEFAQRNAELAARMRR